MTSKIAKFHCSIRKRAWWPRFYMLTFLYHGPPFVPHLNCWYLLKVLTTSIGQEEKFSKHTLPKYFAEYYWLTIIKIGSRLKIEKNLSHFFSLKAAAAAPSNIFHWNSELKLNQVFRLKEEATASAWPDWSIFELSWQQLFLQK